MILLHVVRLVTNGNNGYFFLSVINFIQVSMSERYIAGLWIRTANTVYSRSSEYLVNVTNLSGRSPQIVFPGELFYAFNVST